MPTTPLPDRPDLEQLKRLAKDLRRAVTTEDADAIAEVDATLPGARTEAGIRLTQAQTVIARRHGFPSWAKLRAHVEAVGAVAGRPDLVGESSDGAAEVVRLGCLTYGNEDGPERWRRAEALLAERPSLASADIFTAVVCGDVAAVRAVLAADAGAATRPGGPFGWEPLLYLTASRIAKGDGAPVIARMLLDAGASPDTGYLWDEKYPFTALTHAFGEGEQGPQRQPRHPQCAVLARMLLEAGAEPNDSQALYNRMFNPDNEHLELLFEFGLGTGDGNGDALRGQLQWAVTHGFAARVRLLLEHGVDATEPFADGHNAAELAAMNGHHAVADLVVELGGAPPQLDAADAVIGAVLAADRATLDALRAAHPEVIDRLRAERPGLMTWAAASGGKPAVELLVGLGFDVNARGRGDTPIEEPWQTALHEAAGRGDLALARRLLELGADPNIRDARFDAPPLGWARHGERPELIALLEPLTVPPERAL